MPKEKVGEILPWGRTHCHQQCQKTASQHPPWHKAGVFTEIF